MPGGVERPSWRVSNGREAFLEGREGWAGLGSPARGLGSVGRPSHMAVRGREGEGVPQVGQDKWETFLEVRQVLGGLSGELGGVRRASRLLPALG